MLQPVRFRSAVRTVRRARYKVPTLFNGLTSNTARNSAFNNPLRYGAFGALRAKGETERELERQKKETDGIETL